MKIIKIILPLFCISLGWLIANLWYWPFIKLKHDYDKLDNIWIKGIDRPHATLEEVSQEIVSRFKDAGVSIIIGYSPLENKDLVLERYYQGDFTGGGFLDNTATMYGVRCRIISDGVIVFYSEMK